MLELVYDITPWYGENTVFLPHFPLIIKQKVHYSSHIKSEMTTIESKPKVQKLWINP